jgi:hypothetical protein
LHHYNILATNVPVSYYWRGSITANGESYNPDRLTCASPLLPFNTKLILRVGKNVVKVRVNDSGPFAVDLDGNVIFPLRSHPVIRLDLSRGTYLALFGELESGIGVVEILEVEYP